MKEIVLKPDEATARAIWLVLYAHGEHFAAGAPLQPPDAESGRRIGEVFRELERQLGVSPRYDLPPGSRPESDHDD